MEDTGKGEPSAAGRGRLREDDAVALSFELSVLSLARPVLVPEIKEVVSHKYKTPMVSAAQRRPRATVRTLSVTDLPGLLCPAGPRDLLLCVVSLLVCGCSS